MPTKITKFFSLLLCFYLIDAKSAAFAQEITLTQTLAYLNNKFEGKCIFDCKHGTLYLECYKNAKKKKYREDIVKIEDLDVLSLVYSEDEKSFVIKCSDGYEKCINRTVYDTDKDIENRYNRMNILYEGDEKSKAGITNALTHMIRLINEPKYHSNQPFEQ